MSSSENTVYDCIIIGGGAAGLAAATVLGRARRTTLLLDAGEQNNRAAPASHGVFARDGVAPQQLYDAAKQQLSEYPSVHYRAESAITTRKNTNQVTVTTADGQQYSARALLLAQGVKYTLPSVPGLTELWGTKAWHCPYCDGYEHTDENLLVIADADTIDHLSIILPSWSKQLSFSAYESNLSDSVAKRIRRNGGSIATDIARVRAANNGVSVEFSDGQTATYDGIVAGPSISPRDNLADSLGCTRDNEDCVARDDQGQTSVEGVFVAGDQTDIMQQVNVAVASGHKAAVGVHEYLCYKENK